ncbi:MAG: M24 family metallopeptidase C-terminal domain-containing protein, partial [Thiomargarita sp.]|nr:M24 family metallopeptidase C-terminal domain-containing protein [Thiomargarita sp.]
SNEPGYYKENAYGIRIENLMTVLEAQEIEGGEQAMLCFETLTRVPIDLTLIEPTLLNRQEKAWLNRYHQKVFKEMSPLLTPKLQSWLENATRPI